METQLESIKNEINSIFQSLEHYQEPSDGTTREMASTLKDLNETAIKVLKLAEANRDHIDTSAIDYLHIIYMFLEKTHPIKTSFSPESSETLIQSCNIVIEPILKILFDERGFADIIFNSNQCPDSELYSKLRCLLYLAKMLRDCSDSALDLWFESAEKNIISMIFEYISSTELEIYFPLKLSERFSIQSSQSISFYEYIITIVCGMIGTLPAKHFNFVEKVLMRNFFHENSTRSMAAEDMLTFIIRLKVGDLNKVHCNLFMALMPSLTKNQLSKTTDFLLRALKHLDDEPLAEFVINHQESLILYSAAHCLPIQVLQKLATPILNKSKNDEEITTKDVKLLINITEAIPFNSDNEIDSGFTQDMAKVLSAVFEALPITNENFDLLCDLISGLSDLLSHMNDYLHLKLLENIYNMLNIFQNDDIYYFTINLLKNFLGVVGKQCKCDAVWQQFIQINCHLFQQNSSEINSHLFGSLCAQFSLIAPKNILIDLARNDSRIKNLIINYHEKFVAYGSLMTSQEMMNIINSIKNEI